MCESDSLMEQSNPVGRLFDRAIAGLLRRRGAAYSLAAERNHDVRIIGEVEIRNGAHHEVVRNRIVNLGVATICVHVNHTFRRGIGVIASGTTGGSGVNVSAGNGTMRTGTASTSTLCTTTALGAIENTAPTSVSRQATNPEAGTYQAMLISTWNAGDIPEITVRELELRMRTAPLDNMDLGTGWATTMGARLTSGDGDFTEFLIDVANPLTIEWRWKVVC